VQLGEHAEQGPPVLLNKLPESVTYVFDKETNSHIYLVGTQHYSEISASDVRSVITTVRPETIMIELCAGRYVNMFASSETSPRPETIDPSRTGGLAGALIGANRITDLLGINSGIDFSAALDAARSLSSRVVLGDIDASATVDRINRASDSRALLPALFSPTLFVKVLACGVRVST
jgi:pheromone shutdown protein TraB